MFSDISDGEHPWRFKHSVSAGLQGLKNYELTDFKI